MQEKQTYRKAGTLLCKLGIVGIIPAELGDPVYEDGDKYFVLMDEGRHRVNYYKHTLEPYMKKEVQKEEKDTCVANDGMTEIREDMHAFLQETIEKCKGKNVPDYMTMVTEFFLTEINALKKHVYTREDMRLCWLAAKEKRVMSFPNTLTTFEEYMDSIQTQTHK